MAKVNLHSKVFYNHAASPHTRTDLSPELGDMDKTRGIKIGRPKAANLENVGAKKKMKTKRECQKNNSKTKSKSKNKNKMMR